MKKQLMTITAIAMGAIAFTSISTTANATIISTGLVQTADFSNESVEVTKVGDRRSFRGRGFRGHRSHRGHRFGHRHGRWGHGRWGHGHWKNKRRHRFGHYDYGYRYNDGWKRYKRCLRLQRQGYRIRCNRPL